MHRITHRTLFTSALLFCFAPAANAVVIDFELATGTIVDDEYAGVTVSAKNLGGGPDVAVIFDTGSPTGGDGDLGAPFENINNDFLPDDYKPGKVLIIHEHASDCNDFTCNDPDDEGSRPAGTFHFVFDSLITLKSIDFFDIETDENGETSNNAIKLFDAANFDATDNEILPETFYTPDTGGDRKWDRLMFFDDRTEDFVTGVKRIELNIGGSGAIDKLNYTVIPVPAAVWLFGSGLLGLVAVARRKAR